MSGIRARDGRHWGDAVLAFERSLRLRPHPQTMYEIAFARVRGGDPEGALPVLRELLAFSDPAPSEQLVEQARTLAREAGENNLSPPIIASTTCPTCPTCPSVEPALPCPEAQVIERPSILPLALGVGGGVVLGLGGIFYGHALGDAAAYNSDQNSSLPLRMELKSRGETFRIVGVIGLIAGLGLEATAVALGITGRSRAANTQSTAAAQVASSLRFGIMPNGVVLGGTF
ncbi:MAG: hypothetical protein Q8Q09_12435 [Deltaproteobacteria bacterium]|nr:hypothetical protein [Deltaproteobacteria bacterium]